MRQRPGAGGDRIIAVTGANGFIGQHLIRELENRGHSVRAVVRTDAAAAAVDKLPETVITRDPYDADAWRAALEGCDAVVHLIGLAHGAAERAEDELERFRRVNMEITERVRDACRRIGVKRLIYLSSIKAVGEGSEKPYAEDATCNPTTAYGISKREAELLLLGGASDGPPEISVLRPPLVYGEAVKGNVERMMKLVRKGFPLPIRCLSARRSMVYVGNLTDALATLLAAPQPVCGVFHVADAGPPPSARGFLLAVAEAMGKRVVQLPVPAPLLRLAGRMVGMSEEAAQLTRSLTVDAVRLRKELSWRAPVPSAEGLRRTVEWFMDSAGSG